MQIAIKTVRIPVPLPTIRLPWRIRLTVERAQEADAEVKKPRKKAPKAKSE